MNICAIFCVRLNRELIQRNAALTTVMIATYHHLSGHLSFHLFACQLSYITILGSFFTLNTSAMKYELQYGNETADQHYGRGSLSIQSVLTHANHFYEDVGAIPVKTCHHFFGDHGSDANHHFTITTLDQYISLVKDESAFNVRTLDKVVLVCDGSEVQNWSAQVMGHLVRRFREAQDSGVFGNLKTLLFVKKSPGHGKVWLSKYVFFS